MWRNLASNVLTLLIVALVGVAGAIGWAQRQYVAEGPLAEAICLQVPRGGSMTAVAEDLAARGAIRNATIYRLGADYSDRSRDLKAGSFLVDPGASMSEIVGIITGDGRSTCGTLVNYIIGVGRQDIRVRRLDPETQKFVTTAEFDPMTEEAPAPYAEALEDVATEYSVTLAEGVTSWQVVEALKATELFTGEVDEVPAEGSLAPDGYEIRPGMDRAAFLAEMVDLQTERLAAAWDNRSDRAVVGLSLIHI